MVMIEVMVMMTMKKVIIMMMVMRNLSCPSDGSIIFSWKSVKLNLVIIMLMMITMMMMMMMEKDMRKVRVCEYDMKTKMCNCNIADPAGSWNEDRERTLRGMGGILTTITMLTKKKQKNINNSNPSTPLPHPNPVVKYYKKGLFSNNHMVKIMRMRMNLGDDDSLGFSF